MYESFFGLNTRPFRLAPDPRFFFQSDIHKKALAHLRYGLQQGEGFVVMTGAPGTGKSTLIYALVDGLPRDICVAEIVSTRLDADDLLQLIAASFKLSHRGATKGELLKSLQEFLLTKARKDQRVVIIVDEAHHLPLSALEELRMLVNYCWNRQEILQIFLLGRDELQASLLHPEMLQLRQRIVVRCQLSALRIAETTAYIESRLYQSNWQGQPNFSVAAYTGIHQFTGGIPRNINIFCDRLLLYAYLERLDAIDIDSVDFVVDELLRETGIMSPGSEVYQSHSTQRGLFNIPPSVHTVPVLLSVEDTDPNPSNVPLLLTHVMDKSNIDKPSTVETLSSVQSPFEINKNRSMTALQRNHLTNDHATQKQTVLSRSSLASHLSVPAESFAQPIPSLRLFITLGITLSLATGLVLGLMNYFSPNTLSSEEGNRVNRSIPIAAANHKSVVAQPSPMPQLASLDALVAAFEPSTGTANSPPMAMVVNDSTTLSNDKPIASHISVRQNINQTTPPTISPNKPDNFNLSELYTLETPVVSQPVIFTSIEATNQSAKRSLPLTQETAIKLSTVAIQNLLNDFIFAYHSGDLNQLTLLFADNVKVDKTNNRVALIQSYQKLFAMTDQRDMQLNQIHWQINGHVARGEGQFSVKVREASAQKTYEYRGQFKLDIEERPQGLVITRLDHSYIQ